MGAIPPGGSPPAISPTRTPSVTPTISVTPSVTPSGLPPGVSQSPSVTPTRTPSVTPSISATPSVTPSVTKTPSVTPTVTVSPSITPTPTPSPDCNPGNILQQMQLAALNLLQTAVGYYKIDLSQTKRNIYGESLEKWFLQPVLTKCSIERDPDTIKDEMFGPDVDRKITLQFPKAVFDAPDPNNIYSGVGLNFLPEIGDIIYERSLDRYFEVHNIIVDYQPYNANVGLGNLACPPLELVTYKLECYHTRVSRLNLLPHKLI
jgi:hypothetical protein